MTTSRLSAQVGTCPVTILDWGATFANNAPYTTQLFNASGGSTRRRLVITTSDIGGEGLAPNFVIQTQAATGQPFGNQPDWYQLRQNAVEWDGTGDPPSRMVLTFEFRNNRGGQLRNVNGFTMTLLDIDNQPTNGWNDRVYIANPVRADGVTAATYTYTTASGTSPPAPTGSGTLATPWLGSTAANEPNNSTGGNLTVVFTSPMARFELWYTNGTVFFGSQQRIGIGDLSWCTPTSEAGAPGRLGDDGEADSFVAPLSSGGYPATPPMPGPGPVGGD